jgi:thioredoxin-like negative regulator of GroEL
LSEIEALTRDRIGDLVLAADQPVIIDVWGPECRPCIALAPTFETLSERFADQAKFLKLEAPKNRMACVDLMVMNLPTFLWYSGGKEIERLSGIIDADRLSEFVESAVSTQERREVMWWEMS